MLSIIYSHYITSRNAEFLILALMCITELKFKSVKIKAISDLRKAYMMGYLTCVQLVIWNSACNPAIRWSYCNKYVDQSNFIEFQ